MFAVVKSWAVLSALPAGLQNFTVPYSSPLHSKCMHWFIFQQNNVAALTPKNLPTVYRERALGRCRSVGLPTSVGIKIPAAATVKSLQAWLPCYRQWFLSTGTGFQKKIVLGHDIEDKSKVWSYIWVMTGHMPYVLCLFIYVFRII